MFYASYSYYKSLEKQNRPKKKKKNFEEYDFDSIFLGEKMVLPDSRMKYIDTDSKISVNTLSEKFCTYIHRFANEPSKALYRVNEHVVDKVPLLCRKHEELGKVSQKVEKKMFDVKYSIIGSEGFENAKKKIRKMNKEMSKVLGITFKRESKKRKTKKRGSKKLTGEKENPESAKVVTMDEAFGTIDEKIENVKHEETIEPIDKEPNEVVLPTKSKSLEINLAKKTFEKEVKEEGDPPNVVFDETPKILKVTKLKKKRKKKIMEIKEGNENQEEKEFIQSLKKNEENGFQEYAKKKKKKKRRKKKRRKKKTVDFEPQNFD